MEVLHLGMRRALAVFRCHYQKIDLEALSEGYVDMPKEELAKILAAKFEEEVVPPPLDL
jgi:DNA primase large subunit